jgi:hypothetical protein
LFPSNASAKYYRDMGDNATAATYSEYSLHYAKLAAEEGDKDSSLPEAEAVAGDAEEKEAEIVESSPGRKRKTRSKSPEAKNNQSAESSPRKHKATRSKSPDAKPPAKANALAMLSGYGSDSDGSD